MERKFLGLAIHIHYPDFAELADFLSGEGKQVFLDGLRSAVEHALLPQPHWLQIHDEGSASVVVEELNKATLQRFMNFAEAVHRDVRIWTGTFGKIGIPPMKYDIGVTVGEIQISQETPKSLASISGQGLQNSIDLSKKFCPHFNERLAVEGDLARFAEHPQDWIDLDDLEFSVVPDGPKVTKRIFAKLIDREEPEDVQLLRSARKAFFQKEFSEAQSKFDRLSRIKRFKRISEIYLKRLNKRSA